MLLTFLSAAHSRTHLQLPSLPALGGPKGASRAPISALKTSQRAVSRENVRDLSFQGCILSSWVVGMRAVALIADASLQCGLPSVLSADLLTCALFIGSPAVRQTQHAVFCSTALPLKRVRLVADNIVIACYLVGQQCESLCCAVLTQYKSEIAKWRTSQSHLPPRK